MNLGLIPSSEAGWVSGLATLRIDSGGILHIHTTVTSSRPRDQCEMSEQPSNSAESTADDDSSARSTRCQQKTDNCTDYRNQSIPPPGVLLQSATESKADSTGAFGSGVDTVDADVYSTMSSVSTLRPSGRENARMMKFAKTCAVKPAWREWADGMRETLKRHLSDMQRSDWSVSLLHIQHVKSYAPHIDHIVVDVQCRPPSYQLAT